MASGPIYILLMHHTRQESRSEVCLNLVPVRGNTRLYPSGKPGLCEACLRI